MTKDTVTNQQLYQAILDVHKKIDEVVEKRITPLELWKSEIMGKIAVVGAVLIFTVNLLFEYVREKFLKHI